MATTVSEVANPELFAVHADDRAADVLSFLIALGISTCPVQNADGTPAGVVGLRALYDAAADSTVGEIMNTPAVTIPGNLPLTAAAELMSESGYHHLIVVDNEGRAVSMLSSLDLIRGLAGLPISHPGSFPHYDIRFGVVWSDEYRLETSAVEAAPAAAGVLSLIAGRPGVPDRVVWSEHAANLRDRLLDLVSRPLAQVQPLRRWLEAGSLRFRTAQIAGDERARRVVDALQRTSGLARGV